MKKLISLLVILIAVLLVAACGSEDTSSSNNGGNNETGNNGSNDEVEQSNDLTVYTAFPEHEALFYMDEFEEATGINVSFVRLSAGQILARLQAEENNPQASIWFGGPSDTFIAGSDLLEPYEPAGSDVLPTEFADSEWHWSPVYVGALGFASNTEWLERNNVDPPTSWDDLIQPVFEDNISVAHPASSGTAYSVLATLVQLMGEDEAFEYLKKLDRNMRQYTQSGSAPANNAGLGEVAVGLAFAHDILAPASEGYPITLSFPQDGTGYEVGAVAMVKGGPADEVANAQAFIDWAVSKEGQDLYEPAGQFRLPVHPDAVVPEGALPLSELDTIEYDAVWAGENRERLINRFEDDVRGQDAAQ